MSWRTSIWPPENTKYCIALLESSQTNDVGFDLGSEVFRRETTVRCDPRSGRRRWIPNLWWDGSLSAKAIALIVSMVSYLFRIARYLSISRSEVQRQRNRTDSHWRCAKSKSFRTGSIDRNVVFRSTGEWHRFRTRLQKVNGDQVMYTSWVGYVFLLIRMLGAGETDEDKVNELKQQLNDRLDVYEKILARRAYLAGEVSGVLFLAAVADVRIVDLHIGWSLSFAVRLMAGEDRWRAFLYVATECSAMVGNNNL